MKIIFVNKTCSVEEISHYKMPNDSLIVYSCPDKEVWYIFSLIKNSHLLGMLILSNAVRIEKNWAIFQ